MSHEHNVELSLDEGYAFTVDWNDPALPALRIDEPPPLGGGTGPNAPRLLGAAIAQCLASSFLFCARKARIEVVAMRASARVTIDRVNGGRLRVTGVRVDLAPTFANPAARYDRCLDLFEEYCTVTASVRQGLDVAVFVDGVATKETRATQAALTSVAFAEANDIALAGAG